MPHPHRPPVYRVLGPLEIAGVPAAELGSARQRAFLACLLAQEKHWAPADTLIDVLWGDRPPRHPAAALHTQAHRLRELLRRAGDAGEVVPEQRGYRLVADRSQVDAWQFEALLDRAGSVPVAERAGLYGRALALWRGRAFEEIAEHPAVQLAATRLDELRLAAVEDRAAALVSVGGLTDAIAELSAFVTAHPLRERALELLMTALYQAGRQGDALAVFADYQARIAEDLGLDPSPALRKLQLDILNQVVPAVRREAPVPPAAERPRSSLPAVPLSKLFGREQALAALVERVGEHRLLTVVGPGGVGKTRLVTHALQDLAGAFPDGVWWCDLAVVTTGVAQAVASALGVAERSGVSMDERLREYLEDRRCLVVLDNCEHVAADAARVAELLATSGTQVRVLATSREALRVDGERLFTVDPLETDETAVRLFFDRAEAHDAPLPDGPAALETVRRVCRRLDGLPLAIELAAARMRSLSAEEILRQLEETGSGFLANARRGAPGRHRDMWSVVDWSYRLLEPAERTLLERLSVFAGPFDRVAARVVCAGGDARPEHLDTVLGGLVDKSLVAVRRADGTRYRLLETVREYGAHRLAPYRRRECRDRHARHYIEACRRADRLLWGPEEYQGWRVIEDNIAELRAARTFLRDIGDLENQLALSASLHSWLSHRSMSEAYRWAEAAVAAAGAAEHPDFALVSAQAAYGAWQRGDRVLAARLVERGFTGQGPVGHLHRLDSQLKLFEGRLDEAIRLTELAQEAFTGDGLQGWAESCELIAVLAHAYRGDAEAVALAERYRERMRAWGAPSMVGWSEFALGEALQTRDVAEALACFNRVVAAAESVGANLLEGVARVAALAAYVRQGSPEPALAIVPALLDHWARAGVWHQQWLTLRLLAEALTGYAAGTARMIAPGKDAVWTAAALIGAHDAAQTAGPVYGDDVTRLDRVRERLHDMLGAEPYAQALRHGSSIGDQGALTMARSLFTGPP